MNGLKHSHAAPAAFGLLVFTFLFVGIVLFKNPEFRADYFRMFGIVLQKEKIQDPETVSITEFGTTTEVALISENSTSSELTLFPEDFSSSTASSSASTTPELTPTELEGFKPSPESAWASLYFNILEMKQDDLELGIEYVRQWQQTGGLTRDLQQGSKGTDVKLMQYLLSVLDPSFKRSYVTGNFGPQTKTALANFQKKLKLAPTGTFRDETKFFFDSVYFKELCPDADPEQDKTYENVGRRIAVPLDYIPSDLIRLPRTIRTVGIMCLSREPAKRLADMFAAASREGYELAVFSAYRSAKTQVSLTNYYNQSQSAEELRSIAEAGHSEHQLGTTIDVTGRSIKYAGTTQTFGTSPEGRWLADNSYKFGFILSYPSDKDTGYIYEPWHFRFVGVDTARDIFEEKLTIQEYFNLVKGGTYSLPEENEIIR